MNARLKLLESPVAGKALKHIIAAGSVLAESTLPLATQELVKLRASQINGCAGCLDMHTKEAAHAGETAVRLHLVAAWREATVFTDAERAALVCVIAVINAFNRLNVITQQPAGDYQVGMYG
ncbi:carboxymuconolactone decarboxylase family protein [Streptomyces sp. ITFR-6]|uniref:carboxymuconolactone decarboxylase family protein n=1 Tax=Streptomyces sp. ITFR-6 TaxID=3075197 RepID=UPI00288A230E|nr:carboxymuconolactone decarboxylase family protein [Streptomyces sp. ITFR-6]WNI31521.1 carboxymuconolactone decarboxylase family protein [Streptomyces sp. ITFR-6]